MWRRARRDTARGANSLVFVLVTAFFGAAVAVVAAVLVANDASVPTRALSAALAAAGGTVVALTVFFAWNLARAPFRQRDEARDALRLARGNVDAPHLPEFAEEFSDFVRAVRAAQPRSAFNVLSIVHLSRAERARAQSDDRRASDQARREALADYQARFQQRMIRVLERHGQSGFYRVHRASASAPQRVHELVELDDALKRMLAGPEVVLAERIDAADQLRAEMTDPSYVANYRGALDRWRSVTEVAVAEQSADWAQTFGHQPDRAQEDLPRIDELRSWLDHDREQLVAFATTAAGPQRKAGSS